MRSPSIESGATVQTEEQRSRPMSSSVEDYLLERKESREHQAKVEVSFHPCSVQKRTCVFSLFKCARLSGYGFHIYKLFNLRTSEDAYICMH